MLAIGSNLIFILWIVWICTGILFAVEKKKGVSVYFILFLMLPVLIAIIYRVLFNNGFTDRDISQHLPFFRIVLSHGKMPHDPYRLVKHVIYSCSCGCCH